MNPDDCNDCGAGSIARDPHTHACAVCEARRVSDLMRQGLSEDEATKQAQAEWAKVMEQARAETERIVALYDGDSAQEMAREVMQDAMQQDPRWFLLPEAEREDDLERVAHGMTRQQWGVLTKHKGIARAQQAQAQLDAACYDFARVAASDHTQDEYMKAVEQMTDADDEARRASTRPPYAFRTRRNTNPPF